MASRYKRAWSSVWVDGKTPIENVLNKLEDQGVYIHSIIYKRYNESGKSGYTVICYREVGLKQEAESISIKV